MKSKNTTQKKSDQLGMNYCTAQNRLWRIVVFGLVIKLGMNVCYHCKTEIDSVKELSLEHKVAWQDNINAKDLFWDIENITFSHLKCNVSKARKPGKFKKGQKSSNPIKKGQVLNPRGINQHTKREVIQAGPETV